MSRGLYVLAPVPRQGFIDQTEICYTASNSQHPFTGNRPAKSMTREPILQPPTPSNDEDRALRPQHMGEMVGQREVYARVQIAVEAATKRDEPLGHVLFDGPPGLGKTTFATCIPRDLGVSCQIASGATLRAPKDLVPYLTNAEENSVLFIDEIHRMQKAVEEFLYPAMEDFRIDLTLGEGVNARTLNIQLKPFTLIGATTRTGLISAPLRDRFQLREHLDFYTVEELARIIMRNAGKLQVETDTGRGGRDCRFAVEAHPVWRIIDFVGCETMRWPRRTARSPWKRPRTAWICWESTGWGSIRRTANTWGRSLVYLGAGPLGSRRLLTP